MFDKNRLSCIVAIMLCGGLSAGCNHVIDVTEQKNRTTANNAGEKTATADSDTELSSAEQIRTSGSNPVAANSGFTGQRSSENRMNSNSADLSTQGNSVVSTLRIWRDRDAQYPTNAELLEISLDSKSVKLLKQNGIAISVPIERLSEHDKIFLMHVLAAQNSEIGKINPKLVEQTR